MSTRTSINEDALLVRLIEEGLFLSHADKCAGHEKSTSMSNDERYLVEQVFPTLVPGLHDLLESYKDRFSDPASSSASAQDNNQPDPVMWLAQYLLRNNAHHPTSRLAGHPFQLINSAIINNSKSEGN